MMTEKYQSREERRKQQQAAKNSQKGKKRPRGSLFKQIFLVLVILGIIGIVGGAATFAYMIKDAPKLDADALKASIPSEIYGLDGQLVTEVGSKNLEYVEYEDIPELMRDAVIATEDARFFKHHGIDPIRLGGAVLANFTNGFGAQGGSTITQQVVKNYFLTAEKTLSRKAQEAWLAIQLERKYTKEDIFEMYFNVVFMSERATGIGTASQVYFGKDLKDLTLPEAALLAGMPQSPNNYNPFTNPEKAEKRRNTVLSLMHQHGYISEKEMKEAQAVPVTSSLVKQEDRQNTDDIPYDAFVGQVIKEIEDKFPEVNVYTDGLKIYTTFDKNAQDYIDQLMFSNDIIQFPDDKFQAGITLLDTKTGEIRAIGGSRNNDIDFGLNFATSVPRQPGSTIKPVLDYGPAIEYLKWGTYQPLVDEPYKYSTGQSVNNWDMKYMGNITMRTAIAESRNVPAVKTLQEVGLDHAKEFANNLGLGIDKIYESSAIGGLENGVTSLQMAGAFSAFGNNGYYTEPHSVNEIVFRDGTKINMKPETEVVMSDYTAFMITDMLKSVITSGSGRSASVPGVPVAGKTGTTNYSSEEKQKWNIQNGGAPDIWFVGYTTNYTISVWTGYQERKYSIAPEDQDLARAIFKNVMTNVSKGKETADFTVPNSVQRVKIERGTSNLASDYTPESEIVYEYAVKGNAPSTVSDKYKKLNAPSGLSAKFDPALNQILLTWQHSESADNLMFNISVSVNGGGEQAIAPTAEKGYKLTNPVPGSTYTFKITAVRDGQTSDPSTTTVQIPISDVTEDKGNNNGNNQDQQDGKEQDDQNSNVDGSNPIQQPNQQQQDTPINNNQNGAGLINH